MSQVPMSSSATVPPGSGQPRGAGEQSPPGGVRSARRSLGTNGWVALVASVVIGLVYTGVLSTFLALGVGSDFGTAFDMMPTSAPAEPFSGPTDDPFRSGDPTDPLYDYPGYQDGDAALVLAQPSAEEARAQAQAGLAAVEAALLGGWTSADHGYDERSQNAYGGPSLLHHDLSATAYADADLSADADKQMAVDRFNAALAPLAFDEVEVADTSVEWSERGYDLPGQLSDRVASASLWLVTASSSAQSVPAVAIGLVDLASDLSGQVEAMLRGFRLTPPEQGAFLADYVNGVLEEGDRSEFTARMARHGGIAVT